MIKAVALALRDSVWCVAELSQMGIFIGVAKPGVGMWNPKLSGYIDVMIDGEESCKLWGEELVHDNAEERTGPRSVLVEIMTHTGQEEEIKLQLRWEVKLKSRESWKCHGGTRDGTWCTPVSCFGWTIMDLICLLLGTSVRKHLIWLQYHVSDWMSRGSLRGALIRCSSPV